MSISPEEKEEAERFSLSRWSRRKREVARADMQKPETSLSEGGAGGDVAGGISSADSLDLSRGVAAYQERGGAHAEAELPPVVPLPDISTLTSSSDFSVFMREGVDDASRQAALKKLFQFPEFNVMDGIDVYVDDYSKSEPLTPSMLEHFKTLAEKLSGSFEEIGQTLPNSEQAPPPNGEALPAATVPASPRATHGGSGGNDPENDQGRTDSTANSTTDSDSGGGGDSGGGSGGE